MVKNVLLVDDDQEMLLALKEGFAKYQDSFSVLLASDGQVAVESLQQNMVSLVVTDLKMPRMDGFELLAHIMEHYPDIPVIIITGYSTPEMEQLAREGGAVGYISKPFLIENLARQILTTLRSESEGGTLHNVSSGMFLQLMEMEQKTCTIRLEDKSTGKKGILFFSEGTLLDGRANDLQGEEAAYEIFSWDQVNLSIQNGCPLEENKIGRDLHLLLLNAARRKDEAAQENTAEETLMEKPANLDVEETNHIERLKEKVEHGVGPSCGLQDIYEDQSWDNQVAQLTKAGEFFNLGKLILGYIDKGDTALP